ncbi:MAG: peroxiredoxin family protein [Candidatus Hodarchaeota archaeon]
MKQRYTFLLLALIVCITPLSFELVPKNPAMINKTKPIVDLQVLSDTNSSDLHVVPNFNLTNVLNGKKFSLKEYLDAGKAITIQFFYVGCGWCFEQFPALTKIHQEFSANSVIMSISIHSSDGDLDSGTGNTKIYDYAIKNNIEWPIALDTANLWNNGPNPKFFGELSVSEGWGVPVIFLLNPSGQIIWWQLGYSGEEYYKLSNFIANENWDVTAPPSSAGMPLNPLPFLVMFGISVILLAFLLLALTLVIILEKRRTNRK